MSRARVFDATELARGMRETFADRPAEFVESLRHGWPKRMQLVGRCLAVAYESDKWKKARANGSRDTELYKHLSENRTYVLVKPGLLRDDDDHRRPWPVEGPMVSLADMPLPTPGGGGRRKQYAYLSDLEELDLELFGDDEPVKVTIGGASVAGSYVLWSQVPGSGRRDEPFLFVYTAKDGVVAMLFGRELDVEADGIVG